MLLDQDIMYLTGVGPRRKALFEKELGLSSVGDLLEYYPYKYVDRSRIYRVSEIRADMPFVQLRGRVLSYESFAMGPRKTRLVGHFSDDTGIVDLTWFASTQWVTQNFPAGRDVIVFGRPTVWNGRYQMTHPEIADAQALQIAGMGMQPHYHTTERMKKQQLLSRNIEQIIKDLLVKLPELPETLPPDIVARLHLASRTDAIRHIHYPHTQPEMQAARERLKFEELFYVQLNILRYVAKNRRQYRGFVLPRVGQAFGDFFASLPFQLTGAQKRVVHEIQGDVNSGRQMNRLVQGDVGSGKTLVALMAMLLAVDNGFQAVMMAPTEILAEQHLATLTRFLEPTGVRVELLTGIVKGKRRKAVMQGLADGTVKILVGTHAVIEPKVVFANLGLAVVDEQHRFGVAQRAKLWAKNTCPPHILVMTATPIPRTLAMTIYGDLDVSVIDELPPGRKPIATIHKYDTQKKSLYAGLRREMSRGRQVYVVFPLIKESETMDLQNLEQGYAELEEAFPEFRLGYVHGQMKAEAKERQMAAFAAGETQMLVATTVIEVGVDVPNATVMVVMDAQRFGLSQLHQLRGRVGRGGEQSYCILVSNFQLTNDTRRRLDIMCQTCDGFQIAEADLKLRGPGDLEGTQQSGMALDLKIADIARDGRLVQMARDEAQRIIDADHDLSGPNNALLRARLEQLRKDTTDWGAIS